MKVLIAFACGAVFGVGLLLSGMTQPSKVFGFLNVTEAWDPSLALVMGGALAVYVTGFRWVRGWRRPVMGDAFHLPAAAGLTWQLGVGAALFGAGWAISGFCPGPSIVALGGWVTEAVVFVPAMILGMVIHRATLGRNTTAKAGGA